jgi:predicted DNA-binding transcriptional regulator YafY
MKKEPTDNTLSRLARLIELMRTIKSNPRQLPEQLWTVLGVSRSQYFADKKALAEIGFVFRYDRRRCRYVVENDLDLPVSDLTGSEVLSLVMAVRQISAAGDHTLAFDAVNAIRKLFANSDSQVRDLLGYALDEVVLRRKFSVDSQIVESLRLAQEGNQRLEILYDDFSQRRERRFLVEPYALYFKGRALYLDAFVPEEKDVRMLRVSRVKRILRYVGTFETSREYNFHERHRHSFRVFTGDGLPQKVRIKFDANTARYIGESYHHESEEKLWFEDDSLLLTLHVSEPREVLWHLVFPWGEGAEILEPEWLREEVVRVAQKIMDTHQLDKKEKV